MNVEKTLLLSCTTVDVQFIYVFNFINKYESITAQVGPETKTSATIIIRF